MPSALCAGLDGVSDPAVLEAVLSPFLVRRRPLWCFATPFLATWGLEPNPGVVCPAAWSRNRPNGEDARMCRWAAWALESPPGVRWLWLTVLFVRLFTLANGSLFKIRCLGEAGLIGSGGLFGSMPIALTTLLRSVGWGKGGQWWVCCWGPGTSLGLLLLS